VVFYTPIRWKGKLRFIVCSGLFGAEEGGREQLTKLIEKKVRRGQDLKVIKLVEDGN
jgi:hypothetical protein